MMLAYTKARFPTGRNSGKNRRIGGHFYRWVTLGIMRPLVRDSPHLIFQKTHRIGGTFLHMGDFRPNAPIGASFASSEFSTKVAELGGNSACAFLRG